MSCLKESALFQLHRYLGKNALKYIPDSQTFGSYETVYIPRALPWWGNWDGRFSYWRCNLPRIGNQQYQNPPIFESVCLYKVDYTSLNALSRSSQSTTTELAGMMTGDSKSSWRTGGNPEAKPHNVYISHILLNFSNGDNLAITKSLLHACPQENNFAGGWSDSWRTFLAISSLYSGAKLKDWMNRTPQSKPHFGLIGWEEESWGSDDVPSGRAWPSHPSAMALRCRKVGCYGQRSHKCLGHNTSNIRNIFAYFYWLYIYGHSYYSVGTVLTWTLTLVSAEPGKAAGTSTF